ncbi:MAG: tetratricopeptide repeat protein [Phycisphaera sp.]|nr:tetratricopeptide repeat protein [Phycisphaera sp.]
MKYRFGSIVCVLMLIAAAAQASALDDRVKLFKNGLSTPDETQLVALLKSAVDERRSAEALAVAQVWLNTQPITRPDAMFYAGLACEDAGQWLTAIGYYQRLLQLPKPDPKLAGPAVDGVYRLLLGALGNENDAYLFMRNEGNRVRGFGRAVRYDRWFLDKAREKRDLIAVSDRLAAFSADPSTPWEPYADDLDWLCFELEKFRQEGSDVYASAMQLAQAKRTPTVAAARLRWAATVMPYNQKLDELRNANSPVDPKLSDAPLAAAEQLMAADPERGAFTVADGWGVEYDNGRSGNCAMRFNVEGPRKLDQLLAVVPKLSVDRQDDLLGYRFAQGRVRFDPALVMEFLSKNPTVLASLNALDAADVIFFDKDLPTVEQAQFLAPHLARNPNPRAALIRAIASSRSVEFGKVAAAMVASELWRFENPRAAIELAWRNCTVKEAKLEDVLKSNSDVPAPYPQLLKQVAKGADSKQRLAAFKTLDDDLKSQAPKTPAVFVLWDQLFANASNADTVAMLTEVAPDTASSDGDYLFRRALDQSRIGNRELRWQAVLDWPHFKFNRPQIINLTGDWLARLQVILEKQMQSGDLSPTLFGFWLQSVDPEKADAKKFIRTLSQLPVYDKLDRAYRVTAADDQHFGLLTSPYRSALTPRTVSRELLELKDGADAAAVEAALDAVLKRASTAPQPVTVIGLRPVLALTTWSPQLRDKLLTLLGDNAPLGDYPERQGYEDLIVRLCKELRKEGQWEKLQAYSEGLWRAAQATDDARYYRGVQALADFAEAALDADRASTALSVARGVSASPLGRALASNNNEQVTTLAARLNRVEGKASIALGIIDIPVDERDPAYPIFKAQAEFATGRLDSAWDLYNRQPDRLTPVLRRLTVPFCLWLLDRDLEAQQSDRAEALIREMTVWSREAVGAFTPEQEARLKIAYADASFQKGSLQTARAWYRRVADAQEYRGTAIGYEAELRCVRVDRASRDFPSALEILDKLMLVRDEALRQRVHFARAEVFYDQARYADAFAEVSTVLRRDPGHADALILMGKAQLEMRKLVDASEIELGVTRDQRVIVPGESIKINLNDPSLNITGVAAEIEVEVRTKSGDVENVMLHQFGDEKSKYRAEVPTQLGARQPGDKVLQVLGRDEITYGYSKRFRAKMKDLPPDPTGVITVASDAQLDASAGAFPPRKGERKLDLDELGVSTAQKALGTRRVRPGNQIYVRVTDPDQSKTDGIDRIIASVETSSGDKIQKMLLTETGTHTGVFEATVPTGRAQALAFATESAPGRDPNMVLSAEAYPGWAGEVGSKVSEHMFTIDLNDNVSLGAMTIDCDDASQSLTRFVVQTSMNGEAWTTRARFPDDPAPWDGRPQVTSFPTYGKAIPISKLEDRKLPEDWLYKMDIASLRAETPYSALYVPNITDMNIDLASGGHPAYGVLIRYRALFYQSAAAVRTFQLEGFTPTQTLFLIDGQSAGDESETGLTIQRELKPGLHTIEVWHEESRVDLVKRKPAILCDVAGQENLQPCADAMFNPASFPAGVRDAIAGATRITADPGNPNRFAVAFGNNTQGRLIRLAIVDHKGAAPAIHKVLLTDRSGIKRLPVADDYQKLRTNDRLEVLPGDTVTVHFDDDNTVNPRRASQQARLSVAYNTATITAAFLNYINTPEGPEQVLEPIRRFKMDNAVAVVINDPDMDQTPEADRVQFIVRSSDGSEATLDALETGPHTGEFIRSVFPVTGGVKEEAQVHVPPGGTLTARYRDEENLDPGIPTDRTVTVEHAYFNTPVLAVYDTISQPLAPNPSTKPNTQPEGTGDRVQEVVQPRRALSYRYLDPAHENTQAGAVIGSALRVDVIVPHLAYSNSSTLVAYVQTQAGRDAYRAQNKDVLTEPFDVRVPGTMKLVATPSTRAATLVPAGYVVREDAKPPTNKPALEEGRFAFSVPLELGDVPSRSFATQDADDLPSSLKPEALAVRPGDKVYVGFACLDPDGKPIWLTHEFTLTGDVILDAMDGRYHQTLASAFVGEKVYLRLIAPELDKGPGRDITTVRLQAQSGVAVDYELRETDVHTGVFKGSFTLSYATTPSESPTSTQERPAQPQPQPSVVLHGLPVRYGDLVTVTSPRLGNEAPPTVSLSVNLGSDGFIEPFSKQYSEDASAIQTTFTLAECYFELAKHHRTMGQESLARREMGHAEKLLAEAVDAHQDSEMKAHAEYLLGNLAQEYADLSKNDQSKREMYQTALARFSSIPLDYPDTEFAPKAQFKKALVYEKLGQVDIAVEEYVKLAYKYPNHELIPSVMSRLGAYFQDQGLAHKTTAEGLEENKNDAEAQGEAIKERDLATKEYLKAAQVFKKLLERFPTDPLAGLAGLRSAQNYMRAGHFNEAIAGFKRVVDNEEYDDKEIRSQALFWSGISHERLGDLKTAYQEYRRVTFDFPDSVWAKQSRGRLADPAFAKIIQDENTVRERLLESLKEERKKR